MTEPRIAFFGGSFDPPHRGHLAIAHAARRALAIDTVLFAPVGAQPLKPQGSTAPFADRVAMTHLAIAGEPGFAISLVDAPNTAGMPNYTLDTLDSLRRTLPAYAELFCLMGADSFASLRRWRGGAEIPFSATLVVASRPGQALEDLTPFLPEGVRFEPTSVESEHENPSPAAVEVRAFRLRDSAGRTAPFYWLPGLDVEVSATEIRRRIRSDEESQLAAQELVPTAVAQYIRQRHLYR